MNPIALNGPIVTIRRFPDKPVTMQKLIGLETISLEAAQFLETLVKAGYNIFVSGGTGSGKTTFLNVLSGYISAEERVITIEDSAELQLQGLPNLVRLETRNGNTEGCREIGIRELIRSSLRMRPDRIIVGEVRGPEAIDMLQCMNTGHDGSMSTGHANSATDMLARLENMVLMGMDLPLTAIRNQIASGVDVIVHLGRIRDKSRRVLEITEVVGCENGEIRLNPFSGSAGSSGFLCRELTNLITTNSTKATMRKLMMELTNSPILMLEPPSPMTTSEKSALKNRPISGLMMSSTNAVTMAVKAPPMTTPTAMSSTLPRMANALNSSKNFLMPLFFSSIDKLLLLILFLPQGVLLFL